jgi:hypothetical protein
MGVPPFTTQGPVTQLGTSGLIASLIGANLNAAGDQAFTFATGLAGRNWVCDYVLAASPSKNVTGAAAGVFTGAGATGQTLAPSGSWAGLTATGTWQAEAGTNTTASNGAGAFSANTAFLNVATPLGSAGTASFYIFGRVVS